MTSLLYRIPILFLLLYGLQSFAQGPDAEKLLAQIEKHPQEDSQRLALLNKLIRSQLYINIREAKYSAQEAVALARKIGDEQGLAFALYGLARTNMLGDKITEFKKAIDEAITIDRRLGLKEELAWALLLNDNFHLVIQNEMDTTQFDQNEAMQIFRSLGNNEGIGVVLSNQGLAFMSSNQKKALELFKKSNDLLRHEQFEESLVFTLSSQLYTCWANNLPEKAIEIGNELLDVSLRRGFDCYASQAEGSLGSVYRESAQYSLAMEHFLRALKIAEALKDTTNSLTCSLNLGIIQQAIGNMDQAQFHLSKSVDLARSIKNYYLLSYALDATGDVFFEKKDYMQALDYFEQALLLCPELLSVQGNDLACQCFVNQYIRIANTKKAMYDIEGALRNYQTAIDSAKAGQMDYELTNSINYYSEMVLVASDSCLMNTGIDPEKKYEIVKDNCLKTLTFCRANGWTLMEESSLKSLMIAYENLNDPASALLYAKQLMVVKDSILTTDKFKAISNLEIKFETEKKEQHIELLQKDNEKQRLVRDGFIAGFAFVALFAIIFFVQRNKISRERKRSDELLLNILPSEVADELKQSGSALAKEFDQVTILFTDFKGFTSIAESLSPTQLVHELNVCFIAFDNIITSKGIEKIKTIGDAYMAAGGLPDPNTSSPESVVEAAMEMQNFMIQRSEENKAKGIPHFEMRVGIHTGSVVAGIVGIKKFAYDIWGDTVNTASRMESSGAVGRVNISEDTYHQVRHSSKFNFESRGKIEAKGKGSIEMYFVN